jgi:GT2 family glycosyltransferase
MPASQEWEVVVVDNNSSDGTRDAVQCFCDQNPVRFRYLFEPNQGKSYALNKAIRESHGRILAFTDDDVTVDPNWLQNLTSVLGEAYVGSAGRTLAATSFDPPKWLSLDGRYNMSGALCPQFDLGDTQFDLREAPWGANMAFRREMFEKYGTFRLDLGPSAKRRVSSEDTEFGRRLLSGGERLCYVPSATVYHEILDERLSKDFFLTWWFGLGRGKTKERLQNLTLLDVLKIIVRTFATAIGWLVSISPQKRFYRKCQVWFGAGKLLEAIRTAETNQKSRSQVQGIPR